MEPADIDWKKVEWQFARDDLYEHFNAPKWIDLSDPSPRGNSPSSVPSDEAWFCRPDCRHPKTTEDFLRMRLTTPPSDQSKVKLSKAWSSPLGEKNISSGAGANNRDTNLKRRGGAPSTTRDSPKSKLPTVKMQLREDLENQDPNFSPATPFQAAKIAKETIKSSAERPEPPRLAPERPLKSTLSARNLFAGRDILTQISEFCNEIKKLAMPRSEISRPGGGGSSEEAKNTQNKNKKDLKALEEKGEEPLLAPGEDLESIKKKKKQGRDPGRKKGLENLRLPPEPKKKARENPPLLQEVRSCPPTPQRFPSPLGVRRKATVTPVKTSLKPGPPERGVHKELVHSKEEAQPLVEMEDDGNNNMMISDSPVSMDGKPVDLFWFFKPCNYLGGR